jgi:O-antigen ligase
LILLLVSLMVWVIIKRRKKILYLIGIPLLIVGIFFISSNSRISYNINQIERIIKNPSKIEIEGENDRFQMWYSSLPLIKENFVFGIGPSNVTKKLVEKYVLYKFSMAEKFKLNAHNQYLESLLGLGIIGLLILLYILAYCLIKSYRQKNYLLLILIFMLSFEFLFESVLNRMIGIVFMMTFVSMFLFTDIPFYKDAN